MVEPDLLGSHKADIQHYQTAKNAPHFLQMLAFKQPEAEHNGFQTGSMSVGHGRTSFVGHVNWRRLAPERCWPTFKGVKLLHTIFRTVGSPLYVVSTISQLVITQSQNSAFTYFHLTRYGFDGEKNLLLWPAKNPDASSFPGIHWIFYLYHRTCEPI